MSSSRFSDNYLDLRLRAIALLAGLSLPGCAAVDEPRAWNGELTVHGSLRAMFHQGQTGSAVTLDALLPSPHAYAVGALAELAGEVTVVAGMAYLSYPSGDTARTEVVERSDAGATLLVAAEVPAWSSTVTTRPVRFAQLDDEIAALASTAGFGPGERFPFVLEGDFEALQWHVIDGRRLVAGGASHQDHLAASVQQKRERAAATLIGFYSARDETIFTHMGSRTHVHCVLHEEPAAGHVDHVVIPAGTVVRFPLRGRIEPGTR